MTQTVEKRSGVGTAAMSLRVNCQQDTGLAKPGNITLSVNFKSVDSIPLD